MSLTLIQRIQEMALDIGAELKATRLKQGDLTSLATTQKADLVSAINELAAELAALQAASGAQIDDAAVASATKTWSINQIQAELLAQKNALVNGAATALDTLAEIAAALGNDGDFAASMTSALGNRLRIDAAQGLTGGQKTQGRDNLGAQEAALIGDPDTDLRATFRTGLTA